MHENEKIQFLLNNSLFLTFFRAALIFSALSISFATVSSLIHSGYLGEFKIYEFIFFKTKRAFERTFSSFFEPPARDGNFWKLKILNVFAVFEKFFG